MTPSASSGSLKYFAISCISLCLAIFLSCCSAAQAEEEFQHIALPSSILYKCPAAKTLEELNKSIAGYEHSLQFDDRYPNLVDLSRLPAQGNLWDLAEKLCGHSSYTFYNSIDLLPENAKFRFSSGRSGFISTTENEELISRKVGDNYLSKVYKNKKENRIYIELSYHPWEHRFVMLKSLVLIDEKLNRVDLKDYDIFPFDSMIRIKLKPLEHKIHDLQLEAEMISTRSLRGITIHDAVVKTIDESATLTVTKGDMLTNDNKKQRYDQIKIEWRTDEQSKQLHEAVKKDAKQKHDNLFTIGDYIYRYPDLAKKHYKYRIIDLKYDMNKITDKGIGVNNTSTIFDDTIRVFYQDENRLPEYMIVVGEVICQNISISLCK